MGAKTIGIGVVVIGLIITLSLYFSKKTCPRFGFNCSMPAPTLAPTAASAAPVVAPAPIAAASIAGATASMTSPIQAVALVPTPAPVGVAPAVATATTAMGPAATIATVVYPRMLGCYTDNDKRLLPDMLSTDTANNTPATCAGMASLKGYKYFALQDGGYCFGGNNDAYNQLGASAGCTMACPADSSQGCGGAWANSVWQAHA